MQTRGDYPQTLKPATKLSGAARLAACVLALSMLAGCSSVPDAMNPVEWYKGTRDAIVGKDDPADEQAEAPPGADQPIPNLATVPERPRTSSSVDRQNIASGLIADQQGARKYSGDVIPRQGDVPQPPPPTRSIQSPQSQAKPPAQAAAPTPAAPSPEQVRAAAPPPPSPTVSSAPTPAPAVRPAEPPSQTATVAPQRSVTPPGAPSTPPQMREVTAANIAPGSAQPIQPSNIVVPRENPQAPQLRPVTPYVPPPGLEQTETVYIGGSGATGGTRAATPASFRALPPSSAIASEVPGTRPLSSFQGGGRSSYQLASIQFADGSARLSDRDRAVLRGVVDQARRAGGTLRIVGHASSRTGATDVARHRDANARISAERAEVVARELVRLGMAPEAMYVGAVSDADPRYFEFMPTGEAGNRRAEIFIDF